LVANPIAGRLPPEMTKDVISGIANPDGTEEGSP